MTRLKTYLKNKNHKKRPGKETMAAFMLPSLQPDFRKQIKSECTKRSKYLQSTIFGTAFSPSDGFLVGCSSDGFIICWDLDRPSSSSYNINNSSKPKEDQNQNQNQNQSQKRRKTEIIENSKPVFQFQVCRGALYDIQFIQEGELLLACGQDGVFLFDNFLSKIKSGESDINVKPVVRHELKSNPYSPVLPTEINRISYDASAGHIYGAAGDGGGYIWDISTAKMIGNLRHASHSKISHSNGLHAIKAVGTDSQVPCNNCVLTGGANGIVGMWSGKDQKLIESIDCNASMNNNSSNNNSNTTNKKNQGSGWVSSIDVDSAGNWAAIGGGTSDKKASTSSESGFVQLLNMQCRSITTCKETRETIHDIAYHSSGIASVGNDGAVSFWNSVDVSGGPTGRTWLSSPASYSIAIHPDNNMMAIGNVSSQVDCFSEYLTKTCTLRR